jgi:hypothetical protein
MTLRAVILGLLLGLVISAGTYFNDWVIGQTPLIGNHLPISVFGTAALLILVLNPLLSAVGKRLPLRGGEIAVITAIGLSACGWPGSNFFRGFTTVTALPAHQLKTKADWQATNVMSYVPGGSAEIGQGHIRDPRALVITLSRAGSSPQPTPARQIWSELGPASQRQVSEAAQAAQLDLGMLPALTRGVNEALHSPRLYDPRAFAGVTLSEPYRTLLERQRAGAALADHEVVRLNRALVVAALPDLFLPPPRGEGVLLEGGRADPFVLDTLLQGRSRDNPLRVTQIPWRAWWPTIRLWGLAALALAMASLCLALIVHPQWSKRELLPYPLVRFIEEAVERKPDSALPAVAKDKLFWAGFVTLVVLHLINGLHAWYEPLPNIPLKLDFWALTAMFPNAAKVDGSYGYFGPTIYFSVIAFAFFMPTSASFSLGIAHLLLMAVGATLIANGIAFDSGGIETKPTNVMRFGAYAAMALMIAYTGRRYYANVIKSAVGGRREADTPAYATWAARGLAAALVVAVLVLNGGGLHWIFAAMLVLLILITFVVMTRVVTETGSFFIQAGWAPVGVITAVFGFEALGPTTFVTLAVASVVLVIDTREVLMPYLSNGLRMVESAAQKSPGRITPWLALMIVAGFVTAGVTTLYLQYNHSVTQVGNDFATRALPAMAFDPFAQYLSRAAADGTLGHATSASGWARLAAFHPAPGAMLWLCIGLALVLGTAVARLRLPWWPLHPVAFLVWGTYPIAGFGPSFLLGWVVKAAVWSTSGARGYHVLKPLMIGVIAGELLSGLFWTIVGIVHFLVTHQASVSYAIFPN